MTLSQISDNSLEISDFISKIWSEVSLYQNRINKVFSQKITTLFHFKGIFLTILRKAYQKFLERFERWEMNLKVSKLNSLFLHKCSLSLVFISKLFRRTSQLGRLKEIKFVINIIELFLIIQHLKPKLHSQNFSTSILNTIQRK